MLVLGCSGPSERPSDPSATDDSQWIRRGAATLLPFKQQLQGALREGLARGPAEAIQVCRLQAPDLARASGAPGVTVGRTSHRLRNPDNAPRPWTEPLLAAYAASEAGTTARVVRLADGGTGYVEPIYIQPICLQCHGETLAPEIVAKLEDLYPEDRATEFRGGDFRGLFWVEFAPGRPD